MKKILKKLRALKLRISQRKQKAKRVRIKGLGVILVNEDGSHLDVSRWK